jgi:CubicO group peptidase (beta-lactamase class C family)
MEDSAMTVIQGECDPRFKAVRELFEESFASGRENGAALAVSVQGQRVVDLWGGYADEAGARLWERDSLVNVYSTTKGLCAMCAHRLVDQGRLDLDAPVARYWPEFAAAGKAEIPVRQLLGHRAGLAAVSTPLAPDALFDWTQMTRALADQEPWWTPGTAHGYHAITFGWLVGEVVRRISGKSLGTFFRDEIAGPLGLDAHIGLADRHFDRVAEMGALPPPPPDAQGPDLMAEIQNNPDSVTARAFANPPTVMLPGVVNSPEWRRAEIPAANGHTNARSLARLYGALARGGEQDGYRVLSAESVARCREEQSRGLDRVLQLDSRFGLGFMLSMPGAELGPNPRSFGHAGAGGSLGFADVDAGIGFGYTMNKAESGLMVDARPTALMQTLYSAL